VIANRLTLNPYKTQALLVPNKLASNIQITMNKISISFATSVKYLGIEIESSLNFSSYTAKAEKKISAAIGILCKLKNLAQSKYC